ncbi:alpha/beta fold hydrolase [Corynebacterium poyangense]|uniref:Alpha/beta fold hydrolase n=1 Tax=Corynebacterium poyangense TaxID=2684405 RepID=A0A7H0SQ51_9CORY|nr:alpha/beta fold hydrolase [Corynebacterium poyangense]MBZ8178387.1 alpha/beta fold hydrolase [Corynebacterium poyangense]QNQ90676.1 alpha/beta fold hydrolase [Corynebacterium poyangense]
MTESENTWLLDTAVDGPAEAPTIVLGHSLGSSLTMWDEVVPLLSSDFQVVRYNLPGHGGAAVAPLDRPCTMADILAALARTLQHLGVVDFHLAGLSFGGATALAAGIAHAAGDPDYHNLKSISVMSSGPVNAPLDQWSQKIATVRSSGTESLVDATFERWFSDNAAITHPEMVRKIREAFLECDDAGYAQICEVLGSTDLSNEVSSISVPTLLISAEHDGGLPWDKADELALKIAENSTPVRITKLAGVKHMSAVERPSEVAEALRGQVTAAMA